MLPSYLTRTLTRSLTHLSLTSSLIVHTALQNVTKSTHSTQLQSDLLTSTPSFSTFKLLHTHTQPTPTSASMDTLFKLASLPTPIDKYCYLRKLRDEQRAAYYRLLMDHTEAVLPYIYTPTVGEACQRYHKLNLTPHGLYISLSDRGRILEKLRAWPQQQVRVVVVTDGERILGLGDLGTGGMGISEGKITLYSVAAGVEPDVCMPVCLDVGTNNQSLLDDSTYPGLRQRRATGQAYDSFLDEFVQALQQWQPHVLLQFEDFGNQNAFRLLERYGSTHCCFNDDIQGTAAITLAALLAAVKTTGVPLRDQRILFLGAGEAGTGIGELVAYSIHRTTDLSRHEARQHCYFMDSQGLVCASRKNLAHHKQPFAHDLPHMKDLLEVVEKVKPTVLIGVSTIVNAFNEPVIRAMARLNDHPVIMPLSNPTSKSECTFEQAHKWTGGRVIFASGSPFDPITIQAGSTTRVVYPAQSNNAYIFPALGMATILTRASHLSDETFLVAANALAELADPLNVLERGELFPPFDHILDVSVHVAARVAMHLVSSGAGVRPLQCAGPEGRSPEEDLAMWKNCVRSHYWREASAVMAQESRRNKQRGLPLSKLWCKAFPAAAIHWCPSALAKIIRA